MTEQQIEQLRKEAEKAKTQKDYCAYIEARRAYLLAQAEWYYQQRKAAGR